MKKKYYALFLGAAITAAAVGGTAIYGYATQTEAQLDLSEDARGAAPSSDFSAISTTDLVLAGDETESTDADMTVPAFSYSNVADVAEASMPSIVAITNKSVQEVRSFGGFFSRYYGGGGSYQYETMSAGSGIIVGSNDNELLICTNNHVVEDANELTVTFIDEESYAATIKGTDPSNDLAVVAVDLESISDDTMDQIKIARTGDSDSMRVGEQVVAIGNALGYGQSVTTGIISAKDRTIEAASDYYGSSSIYENLIQTDAAINFGNSGGALLNMHGEVIGINSAKVSATGAEGMGYSIPIAKALPILERLMTNETRSLLEEDERGYLGISGQSVSWEATQLYGIPEGIYLTSVSEGGPAETAGLEPGDIILSFDGEAITGMSDLQNLLQYYAAGETVELGIYQNNGTGFTEETMTVTLGDRSVLQ